jgi:RNA polymerase sigma-70 factor (ECF subfamily)
MEDVDIVELYWQRNDQAITETDQKYGRYCHYIAYQILSDDMAADEVLNDTYLRIWNSVPPQKPDPLKPYVGTISRRLSLDRLDYEKAQKRGVGQLTAVLDELSECVSGSPTEDLDQTLALKDALNGFLRSLPKNTRNIFLRRYWYTASLSEIAQEYAIKESTVGMLLLRTRKKLRRYLEQEGIAL